MPHILLAHNEYGKLSGEEVVVRSLQSLLQSRGHEVVPYFRGSAEIEQMRLGKTRAFVGGIYNLFSRRHFARTLQQVRPDVVHVHNLYPLISPSILGVCRRAGIPVVMTVHNYRLVCPNGLHMVKGQVCEQCIGGREYRCVARRCEGSLLKSLGYAIRNFAARRFGLFRRNVTMYAALTDFQRQRLVAAGFPAERIEVVPNMISHDAESAHGNGHIGSCIGYVGRVSAEKGAPTLLEAARELGNVRFAVAGAYDRMAHLVANTPANVNFLGHLPPSQLAEFYHECRTIVLPSTWFEGFPMVLAEAMLHAKPVICSRIGGLPEIVDDGITGLLFTPGNAAELAQKIRYLWDRPELCRQMGLAGREKALREYSQDRYYQRLMAVYDKALHLGPGGPK